MPTSSHPGSGTPDNDRGGDDVHGRVVTPAERTALYGARRFLGADVEKKLGLLIPFDVYFQDPQVAKDHPELAFDEDSSIPWEPGIGDGPTSARFAVVDYDAHAKTLNPPARWEKDHDRFLAPDGTPVDRRNSESPQFHQVSVWAVLQRALEFFEGGAGLGRRIPWAFDGNRLIVVPHAGPAENAFYDRGSKSLQFYYFDRGKQRIHTCLSADIVHHEFGHAVLDGIRPHFIEAVSPETAAFHEFLGDLTAILIAFRNTPFRHFLLEETKGDLDKESTLSDVAEEFGKHVLNKPYLRSGKNKYSMKDVADDQRAHFMSQVLTGAMFDIMIRLSKRYMKQKGRSAPQAFWDTVQRMQHMAIQPLDLLPPVDVTFRDYALAVLREEEAANPTDPDDYLGLMLDVFVERGILGESDRADSRVPHHVFDRLRLDVFHDIETLASSRPDAYRFLDDNRRKLFIPPGADVVVADLCTAHKLTREARRLPKQILLQYLWREDVLLNGPQFGRFQGQTTSLLCGGTLALNETGDLLAWMRKPGSELADGSAEARDEQVRGAARKSAFLNALAQRIKTGRIGDALASAQGLLAKSVTPLSARTVDGVLRFELAPHLGTHDDVRDVHGGRAWQISS